MRAITLHGTVTAAQSNTVAMRAGYPQRMIALQTTDSGLMQDAKALVGKEVCVTLSDLTNPEGWHYINDIVLDSKPLVLKDFSDTVQLVLKTA